MKNKEKIFLVILFCFLSTYCFAGGEAKEVEKIVEHLHLGRYIELCFKYIGLGFILIFLKSVSWSKMTLGGFLSLVGAFFPKDQGEKDEKGETKITSGKFSLILKGGIRFAVITAGIILIVGSIYEGMAGVKENSATNAKSTTETSIDPKTQLINWLNSIPQNYGIIGVTFSSMNDHTFLITSVIKDSPAFKANIETGDIITKINNLSSKEIPLEFAIQNIVGYPGTTVKLEITRNSKKREIEVSRINASILAKIVETQ